MNDPEQFLAALEAHKKILYKFAHLYAANPADPARALAVPSLRRSNGGLAAGARGS